MWLPAVAHEVAEALRAAMADIVKRLDDALEEITRAAEDDQLIAQTLISRCALHAQPYYPYLAAPFQTLRMDFEQTTGRQWRKDMREAGYDVRMPK